MIYHECHYCQAAYDSLPALINHERRCRHTSRAAERDGEAARDRRLDERAIRDDLIKLEQELADD